MPRSGRQAPQTGVDLSDQAVPLLLHDADTLVGECAQEQQGKAHEADNQQPPLRFGAQHYNMLTGQFARPHFCLYLDGMRCYYM